MEIIAHKFFQKCMYVLSIGMYTVYTLNLVWASTDLWRKLSLRWFYKFLLATQVKFDLNKLPTKVHVYQLQEKYLKIDGRLCDKVVQFYNGSFLQAASVMTFREIKHFLFMMNTIHKQLKGFFLFIIYVALFYVIAFYNI